jgi:DNA polymerase elongation subunit (family B)
LEGALALGKLITFPDWRSYQEARSRLAKGGTPFFASNDPVQQYLTFSGSTLFKGMRFEDLRRLQIDIKTAISPGFEFSSPELDAVIAVAMSDSSGWEEIFVIEEGSVESERAALEGLTAVIQARAPDVIEGHNLFKFSLPFLMARKDLRFILRGREGSILNSRPSRPQIAEKTIQYPKFTVRAKFVTNWQYYDISSELESLGLSSRGTLAFEKSRVLLKEMTSSALIAKTKARRIYALQDVRETRWRQSLAAASFRPRFFPITTRRHHSRKRDEDRRAVPPLFAPRPFYSGSQARPFEALHGHLCHGCDRRCLAP